MYLYKTPNKHICSVLYSGNFLFSSLEREKTYSASSEDIERHKANKEKDIQELTESNKWWRLLLFSIQSCIKI